MCLPVSTSYSLELHFSSICVKYKLFNKWYGRIMPLSIFIFISMKGFCYTSAHSNFNLVKDNLVRGAGVCVRLHHMSLY